MKSTILFLFILVPVIAFAAGDIIVNNQSLYTVPPGTTKVLILDLTLPENLTSIKLLNLGTAQHWHISALYIFEDNPSSGFDGDETEIFRKSISPFWDTEISANSSKRRIFVAVDIASAISEKTIKPQATINFDKTVTGFERTILAGASIPEVPAAPLAKSGEALSTSTIRWNFLDLANNEFGFKIKDSQLRTVAKSETADLLYLDEPGLHPGTCYSGRRAYAYNDRGESLSSLNFAEVCTLAAPQPPTVEVVEEVEEVEEEAEEATGGPLSAEELRALIQEIQQKIIELLKQLIQLLQEQIQAAKASLFNAFETFTTWLE